MNLEEKAEKYAEKMVINYCLRPMPIKHFKNGYKECVSDIKDFIRVNPKCTNQQITDYLNSL